MIAEITASSAAYNVHDKLKVYRRNQVQEYLVWQVHERRLDWWHLQEGTSVPLTADTGGLIRSVMFPGLWLATSALLAGNLAEVLATLQAGLAAPEHRAFIEQLSTHQR